MPTPTEIKSSRSSQITAWIVAAVIVLGFFLARVGVWTGPILGAWFVSTQKPRRGFLWMLVFAFVPSLLFGWRRIPLTGPKQSLTYLSATLIVAVLAILPFTFHRLVGPRLSGFLSTLPLPLAAVAIPLFAQALTIGHTLPAGVPTFIIFWFAATIVWMWNRESRATSAVFFAGFILAAAVELSRSFAIGAQPPTALLGTIFSSACLGGALLLAIWALFHPLKQRSWAGCAQTIAILRSPLTHEPLQLLSRQGREALVSNSGEIFPISNGIPKFLKPEDLTGDNGKYNRLYETIGGFYDVIQRVVGAFRGLELDSYFENYMNLLDVKPGDSVLETCVGTALNFKYLPQGTKLSGLDLSPEMLDNGQNNLRRWRMDADLYLGNAEALPFADSTFDVVYTAGGFNFFSDRAQALREMIRVAKPGGHLMIEDETEEYVKSTYEKMPFTSGFYSAREQAVKVPIDLVPEEMKDIRLDMLKDGKFYAITFRKPLATRPASATQAKRSRPFP